MTEDFNIHEERISSSEKEFEKALRPLQFEDFSGQKSVVENLQVFVEAAKFRGEVAHLNHTNNLTVLFIKERHSSVLACGINIGEQIEFFCNGNDYTGELCEVVDDKHVKYNGEIWSLTALAKHLTGTKSAIAGPRYFKYNGEWLNDIRHRLGV